MSFNVGAASVTMKMPQAKARSVICFETREIGNERHFELSRHHVGCQKSYAGGECINDEVAETCVAARHKELRDLDRASEDDERNRDWIARAITDAER